MIQSNGDTMQQYPSYLANIVDSAGRPESRHVTNHLMKFGNLEKEPSEGHKAENNEPFHWIQKWVLPVPKGRKIVDSEGCDNQENELNADKGRALNPWRIGSGYGDWENR